MPAILNTLQDDRSRLRRAFRVAIAFALLLWLIKIVEVIFHLELARLAAKFDLMIFLLCRQTPTVRYLPIQSLGTRVSWLSLFSVLFVVCTS